VVSGEGHLCLDLAAALYANSHSLEAMINVLQIHREKSGESRSADITVAAD
jgi:hypothetical protein